MNDSSWGVRISQETKEYVQQLIAGSGLSSREFFEQLLSVWVTNKAELSPSFESEEIRELEHLFSRITILFSGVLSRERSEVDKLNNELDIQRREIDKVRAENKKLIIENEEIVTKLKDQVAALNEMLVRYQGFEVTNRELEKNATELTNTLKNTTAECDRLKAQIASMRDRNKHEVAQLTKQAERELELLTEKKDLQKEKEILRIRLDYQAKLETVNNDYTAIMQSFQNMNRR